MNKTLHIFALVTLSNNYETESLKNENAYLVITLK